MTPHELQASDPPFDLPLLTQARKKELVEFTKTIKVGFKSLQLLNLSFTHRSAINESELKLSNERLEFLGDAVLGVVAADLLYAKLSNKNEGDLARIKSVVVSEEILAHVALDMGIDRLLILGKGEELSGGRAKKAILADAVEALIAAIYLDSGFQNAFEFVSRFISEEIKLVLEKRHYQDYKSLLQELSQKLFRTYPSYRLVDRLGPEHSRVFWVGVVVNGVSFGPAEGKTKKNAEQEAARLAYQSLTDEQSKYCVGQK